MKEHMRLYQFETLSSEIGGRVFIGARTLKGRNTVVAYFNSRFYVFGTNFSRYNHPSSS